MKNLLITLIKLYQNTLSKGSMPSCRFYPSCSEYAIQSLEKSGLIKGTLRTIKRLLKCHPFHPGGIDLPGEHHDQCACTFNR